MAGKHLGTVYGAHGSKAVMDLKWKLGDDSVGGAGAGWLASAGANKIVQVGRVKERLITRADRW